MEGWIGMCEFRSRSGPAGLMELEDQIRKVVAAKLLGAHACKSHTGRAALHVVLKLSNRSNATLPSRFCWALYLLLAGLGTRTVIL